MKPWLYTILAALTLASCSRDLEPATWEGLDNGTAFHLCATAPPPLSGKASTTTFSLLVSPSFQTPWLMRITIDDAATFELSTQYELSDLSYTMQVSKSLSALELREFVSTINEIGLLQKRPTDQSKMEDGTSLLFEYANHGKYLGFGSNDNQQLLEIGQAFMSSCGKDCETLWSLPVKPGNERPWEQCVPVLQDGAIPLEEYRRSRIKI